ncbi:hypothetical protein [Mesorhizobium sp.]|uniref:hypothetical protein n=1 Tax=Mesorhizobium sp. TaxID=1871066 RepID=UPI000FE96864|nr:hypothetical protein [Mesorhizobium sp.]RWP51081.1 MAG: hypothetical protein EOR05_03955 [Mesorhizobium sp.]
MAEAGSTGTEQSAAVTIKVESDPDAEIFIVRGDLQLVSRGIGQIETLQPPGIYKARVLRAGIVKEELFEARAGKVDLKINIGRIFERTGLQERSELLAPLLDQLAAEASQDNPKSGTITVVVYDTTGLERNLGGLTLFPWKQIAAGKPLTSAGFTNGQWSAARVQVERIPHVLQIKSNGKTARQLVPLLPGRNARVFIRRKPWGSDGDKVERSGREWIDVTVQARDQEMPYADTGNPDLDSQGELELSVRSALGQGRRIVVSRMMIHRLLRLKFQDPLTGIAAAHLMFDAIDRQRQDRAQDRSVVQSPPQTDFDDNLIDEVCRNLGNLCHANDEGGGLLTIEPDLASVWLRASAELGPRGQQFSDGGATWPSAGRVSGPRVRIDQPPVYWRSWEILQKEAASNTQVWLSPDAWSRIKIGAPWGPYLVWTPHRLGIRRYLENAAAPVLERRTRLTVSASVGGRFNIAPDEMPEQSSGRVPENVIDSVAKSLNVPLSVHPR